MSTARVVRQGGVTFLEDVFTSPTLGQTVFPLSGTFVGVGVGGLHDVWVNGARYISGTHYTMSASQMTWIPAACFSIETTDTVTVRYQTP